MKKHAAVHRRLATFRPLFGFETLESRTLLAVFTPTTASQLQTALNSAQLGDDIILQAGTTYVGQFTLPNKTSGSGWITIKSSNLASLPGEGVRVSPSNAPNMPKLQSQGGNASVVRTPPGSSTVKASPSHHYKFIGIEFVGPAPTATVPRPELVTLMELGTSGVGQTYWDSVAHDFVIDRCYFRPFRPDLHVRRAIALNSASTDIINSYIEEIHQPGSDSQAIGGWNGPGPYNIINNRLEGASENIMFGGDRARLRLRVDANGNEYEDGVVPSNIVIRGNHIIKPLHWRNLRDPVTNGTYNIKNLFELKAGRNILVEGNIMENCWTNGQTGVAIVLKLGDWNTTPWNVTENVTIQNNIIRHANGSIALQGRDYASNSPEGLVRNLKFINNVFDDINGKWGTSGTGGGTFNILLTHGPKQVTFDHNTFFNGYTTIEVESSNLTYKATDFQWRNNIAAHNSYGVRSTSGTGNATFNAYFTDPGHQFTKSVLMGGNANLYTSRPGNFFPANWAAVGFVDQANGNYRLAPSSIYNNAGTDGKDLGADIDEIELRTAGVISGVWPQALQTIVVNEGAAQRSMVNTITLTFNQPITSTAGALSLNRRGGTAVNVVATPSADKKTYTLTFSGSGITAGSLQDGIYDFLADVSEFRDSFGHMPVGTRTDQNQTRTFHRLFGDFDGNRTVNNFDYSRFSNAFGSTSNDPDYLWFFDFDGNTAVNNFDYSQFRSRFGTVLSY